MDGDLLHKARAAKSQVINLLRGMPELTGVGIMSVEEGFAVKVNLSAPPESGVHIPEAVNGVPVRVYFTGSVRKSSPE